MGQLCDRIFSPAMRGKAYKTEKDYLDDMMKLVDLSIMSLYCIMFPKSTPEENGPRSHVTKFSGGTDEAYQAVFRKVEETDPAIVEGTRAEGALARGYINNRLVFTEYKGEQFRFNRLVKRLDLSEMEIFVLCLSLAVSSDEKYRRVFADLQGGKENEIPSLQTAVFLYSLTGGIPDEVTYGRLISHLNHLRQLLQLCVCSFLYVIFQNLLISHSHAICL